LDFIGGFVVCKIIDGAADTYLFIGGSAVAASSAGGEGGSGPAAAGDSHCYWTHAGLRTGQIMILDILQTYS
jgi:hypothetical protein